MKGEFFRQIALVALFSGLMSAASSDESGLKGTSNLEFSISSPRTNYVVGEPFMLHLKVSNPQSSAVTVAGTDPFRRVHGLLVVEVSRDGVRYSPVKVHDTICRKDPRQHHDKGRTTLPAHAVFHQWVWSYPIQVFLEPGTYYIRLRYRNRPVGKPTEVLLSRTGNALLDAKLREYAAQDGWNTIVRKPRSPVLAAQGLRRVKAILSLLTDGEAKKSFSYVRDVLLYFAHQGVASVDALKRLESLATDRQFHLRRDLVDLLTGIYTPYRLGSGDDPRKKAKGVQYYKLLQKEWPEVRKP